MAEKSAARDAAPGASGTAGAFAAPPYYTPKRLAWKLATDALKDFYDAQERFLEAYASQRRDRSPALDGDFAAKLKQATDRMKTAILLRASGVAPLPMWVEGAEKRPLVRWQPFQKRLPRLEEILRWPWKWANAVGFLPGRRRVVLDVDDADYAQRLLDYLVAQGLQGRIHQTRRGVHLYLKDGAGLDRTVPIRADGRQIGELIAGPSHIVTYVSPYHRPLDTHPAFRESALEVEDALAFVRDWIHSCGTGEEAIGRPQAEPVAQGETIPEGARNTTLSSLAGTMRRRGMSERAIEAALLAENAARCQPPLPEAEVKAIARSISRYPPAEGAPPGPVLISLARVERKEVEWLWPGRLPLGKLSIIEGDPGVGKSWLALAISAAVTRGEPLPGQEEGQPPANVLILTAEDGLEDTVRPRLEDMGADLQRVTCLTAVRDEKGRERHFSLLRDLPALEQALAEGSYRLLILDPVNAYMDAALDTHRDAAVRSVLTPLAALAERHRLAVIAIRHLTKTPRERPIYRGQGSIAYGAAARMVHLVGLDPNDRERRIFVCLKNNIAPVPPALAFEITVPPKLTQATFRWLGEVDVTPEDLLSPAKGEGSQALEEAKGFLREVLAEGPVPVKELEREAKAAGIAWRMVGEAKRALGVKSCREGGLGKDGYWAWSLPGRDDGPKDGNGPPQTATPPLGPSSLQLF